MSKRSAAWILTLVVAFMLAPALSRATQVLDTGSRGVPTSGIHKSVDVPPDPPVVAPDVADPVVVVEAVTHPQGEFARLIDDAVPVAPFVSDGGALRAPPALPL